MPAENPRARALADAVPALVFVTDAAGSVTFANARFEDFTGRPGDALVEHGWLQVLHPEDRERAETGWHRALAGGEAFQGEYRFRRRDGAHRWHLCRAEPRCDDAGTVLEWIGTCIDIDERRRVESATVSRLESLIHSSPWAIALFDRDLRYVEVNEGAALGNGMSVEEHLGRTVSELLPRLGSRLEALLRQVLDTKRPIVNVEVTGETPAQPGVERHWLASYFPLLDGERCEGVGAMAMEITEHRRAEKALQEQNQRLETLLETLPVGVLFAHDPEAFTITANPAAARLLRMPPNTNISKSAVDIAGGLPFRVFRDGSEVPADALPVQRAARGEAVVGEELTHVFEEGPPVETVVSARPLYDAAGKPAGAVATMLDVTGLKRAERELRANDRRKDEFLAVLAHELRNPLAPIRTGLEIMGAPGVSAAMIEKTRGMMKRQVEHLVHLVDDLLDISRVTRGRIELSREPCQLADAVAAALEISEPLITERRHELVLEDGLRAAPLSGDVQRLTQAIANLLTNAARYTDPGGTITVTTEVEGGEARLRIRDTGAGMSPHQLERAFELFTRFERSGGDGEGLGVGLALAREIVAAHGGSIEAKSDGLGRGSEFVITLPLEVAGGSAMESPGTPDISAGTGRRVLVVDDNVDAADALTMLLELDGSVVKPVHDGVAALEAVGSFRPDVVVLDIGLPGMDGYEVARRIRALPGGRHVRLVALTGWGQEDDLRRALGAGFDQHLTKPVNAEALRRALTAAADSGDRPAGGVAGA